MGGIALIDSYNSLKRNPLRFRKSPGIDLQVHRHSSLTSCREPLSRQESLRECNLVPPPPAPLTLLTASQSSTLSFSPPSGPSSPYSTIRSLHPSTQNYVTVTPQVQKPKPNLHIHVHIPKENDTYSRHSASPSEAAKPRHPALPRWIGNQLWQ